MSDMDDAVNFFNSYLGVEYAGQVAVSSQPDEVVNDLRAEIMTFWHAAPGVPLSPPFGRLTGISPEQLAQKSAETNPVRRELLLAAEYDDPTSGKLYAGYIGGDRELTALTYGGLLYATEVEGQLKIISSCKEDFNAVPPPFGWRRSQGAQVSPAGPPVAVRPLREPTGRAVHRQDWLALRDAAPNR